MALGWSVSGAFAQTAETNVDVTSAAAMARAQRAASNPMRVILEASKIKRRVTEGEAAELAASADAQRKPAARVLVAAQVPSNSSGRPVAAVAVAAVPVVAVPVAATAPTSLPVAATGPNPSPAPAVMQTVSMQPQPQPQPQPITAEPLVLLESPAPAPLSTAVLSLVSPAAGLNDVALAVAVMPASKPRMLNMVSPDIPARVLQQAGRIGEVLVDLALRRDGSVASVTVLPPASRLIQRYVVQALEKWVYEPMAQETVHRVQLVFNDEP